MNDSLKQKIREYFKRQPVEAVYLFGSRAKGEEGPMSDYDFGILFSQNLTSHERFKKQGEYFSALAAILGVDELRIDLIDLVNSPFTLAFAAISGQLLCGEESLDRVLFEARTMAQMHTDFYYIDRDYKNTIDAIKKGVYFT